MDLFVYMFFWYALRISLYPNDYLLIQVFGVLDVQRVAGNFHISVHGLNIFVAQQVSDKNMID